MTAPDAPPARLERTLGLWQVTISGVGIVIGAGIYVLIGEAAREAGNALWLAFALAAVLSVLTGLSYAELAGMFPSASAEYEFARQGFSPFTGFLAGWAMVAGNIVGAAAVAIGFAHYLGQFVAVETGYGAVALLGVLTGIVCIGIRRSIWLSTALVVLQIGGLLMVVAAGAPHIGTHPLITGSTASGVLGGAALVFFAFIGFDEIVSLSDETRDPARVIPRGLLLALAISAALYVAVGISAVALVGAQALAASERPLALVLAHDWGAGAANLMSAIALAATTNTCLLLITTASRLLYGMAVAGAFPHALTQVGARTRAPQLAAVITFMCAAPLAQFGHIGLVAAATDFLVYVIFIVVNAAVISLRYRQPNTSRTFAAPRLGGVPLTPILGLASVLLMLPFLEASAWLLGGAILAAGAGAWSLRALTRGGV
jgi:amino acid transporter